jgi:CubicO group peptidase (beta-lactamase class C family)
MLSQPFYLRERFRGAYRSPGKRVSPDVRVSSMTEEVSTLCRGMLFRLALVVTMLSCTMTAAGGQVSLNDTLIPLLARHQLPALAAAVVRGGQVIAAGAVGTRRVGANIPVTVHDRFHLGSDTKAMTALLAAMFVEAGRLR